MIIATISIHDSFETCLVYDSKYLIGTESLGLIIVI